MHLRKERDKTRSKTRQDTTRQDKTRQGKTRQDKARQDKRRQDNNTRSLSCRDMKEVSCLRLVWSLIFVLSSSCLGFVFSHSRRSRVILSLSFRTSCLLAIGWLSLATNLRPSLWAVSHHKKKRSFGHLSPLWSGSPREWKHRAWPIPGGTRNDWSRAGRDTYSVRVRVTMRVRLRVRVRMRGWELELELGGGSRLDADLGLGVRVRVRVRVRIRVRGRCCKGYFKNADTRIVDFVDGVVPCSCIGHKRKGTHKYIYITD